MIESMHKGKFMDQTPDEAYEFLVDLAENAQNWSSYDNEVDDRGSRKSGIYEIKADPDLKYVMTNLVSKKFDTFAITTNWNSQRDPNPIMNVEHEPHNICLICDSSEHLVECCPSLPTIKAEQANSINSYNAFKKPTPNSFGPVYHPDNRFHPNFSYRQNEPIQYQGGPPESKKFFQAKPVTSSSIEPTFGSTSSSLCCSHSSTTLTSGSHDG
ncbi:hypothetical protein QJS04_geneDACA023241 [Acorus gramineus]|uniref:Uncharacterized protein n=1 Tax=Acorus gramineus TaxID=55184 RepID=A0AAV9A256_ACOGR|nr:hypothetical protein QJS04_geneDACA023241 [Acorus gramineus]